MTETALKVLVTGWPLMAPGEKLLRENGFALYGTSPAPDQAEMVSTLEEVAPDALIVRSGIVDRACFDAAPRLRAIANHGAGFDDIDVEEATRRCVPVFAAPGRNAIAVAEHVFALLLAVRKRVLDNDRLVRGGGWRPAKPGIGELFGTTMGIVGLGAIGERVAALARAFGMEALAFDPGRAAPWPDEVARSRTLDDLLAQSDVISLHVPLTAETSGLIGAEALKRMKPGSILINTARGGVVDEAALVAALEAGRLAGTGLDTFACEPPGADAIVSQCRRIVLSPHIAGVTPESTIRMSICCAENISEFLRSGRCGPDLVNPEWEKAKRV